MEKRIVPRETPLTNYLMNKASRANIPISGTFELSPVCNFACRMCYVRKTAQEVRQHDRKMVTKDQWLHIAEKAREQGLLYLLLTGGEPFLWPDFWELYEKLIHMGFLVSINTNGSLIDDAAIERLKKYPPVRINVTLYGASDETYASLCQARGVFSRVDRAIRGLKEAGISVKLNCSLTPHNAADLKAMIDYARNLELIIDVATYMFPPMRRDASLVGQNDRFTPRESAYYHLQRLRYQHGDAWYAEKLKQISEGLIPPLGLDEACVDPVDGRIRCRAGSASFWITWDGWMMPCGMIPVPKADLMTMEFCDAWKVTVEASRSMALSGVCSKCTNRAMCHSCAAMAVAETGSPSGIPHYLCQTMQAMKEIAAEQIATGNYANPVIG